MAGSTGTFVFDTFEEIDLYDLAQTAQNEDYKKLSGWLCKYKESKLIENNLLWEQEKRKEYQHEYQFLLKLIDSYIAITSKDHKTGKTNFYEKLKMRRRIRQLTGEIFSSLNLPDKTAVVLDNYLRKKNFDNSFRDFVEEHFRGNTARDDVAGELKMSNREKKELHEFINKKMTALEKYEYGREFVDIDVYLAEYEKKLGNHIFLLDELVDILSTEYDRRILSTRHRFEEYLQPLKRVLERIDDEIREIDKDIGFLAKDTSIDKADKKKLETAFKQKRNELLSLKKQEFEKLNSIKLVSENIKEGVKQFHLLIDRLSDKLRYFKNRQFYIEKLARYGADIPKLKNILNDLYSTFNRHIKTLQKSFLLFDLSFQKTVLSAIEDQSVINRIVLSPHGIVDAELEIENMKKIKKSVNIDAAKVVDTIEMDLSYLTPFTGGAASGITGSTQPESSG
ncbi:MAG: hypothetical protein JW904_13040 [Spirochaetales bacterium]|nr:hypothetical protein [Spirochaetales bacterium]